MYLNEMFCIALNILNSLWILEITNSNIYIDIPLVLQFIIHALCIYPIAHGGKTSVQQRADYMFKLTLLPNRFCTLFRISLTFSLNIQLVVVTLGSSNIMAPNKPQAITWTKNGLVRWRIHASLGLNVFIVCHTTFANPLVKCAPEALFCKATCVECISRCHLNGNSLYFTHGPFTYKT